MARQRCALLLLGKAARTATRRSRPPRKTRAAGRPAGPPAEATPAVPDTELDPHMARPATSSLTAMPPRSTTPQPELEVVAKDRLAAMDPSPQPGSAALAAMEVRRPRGCSPASPLHSVVVVVAAVTSAPQRLRQQV